MKKRYKVMIIILLVVLLVASAIGIYFFFFRNKPVEQLPVNEIQITNSIEEFGYTLDDRDTKIFKEKFEDLKKILAEEEYDVEEYVSLVSQLFVLDLYTIDNKISRYDVGGLEYVYPDAVSSFQSVAENSIYKTIENNLDDTRTQDLPEVSEITLDSISETTFIMPDESKVDGYAVKLSWDYVERLGYDNSATLILISSEKKYGVVYFEPN